MHDRTELTLEDAGQDLWPLPRDMYPGKTEARERGVSRASASGVTLGPATRGISRGLRLGSLHADRNDTDTHQCEQGEDKAPSRKRRVSRC